ncbi:hypothetical protein FS837_000720 [Tulasnella sp. UAMH 9824]|nr:hypothetical protein FS837_000720 [Tulasnella sp. UAMH 9824]
MDLLLNGNSTHTLGYAIYKNGPTINLALFNYITDPSSAKDASSTSPAASRASDGRLARRRADPKPLSAAPVIARASSKAPQFALVFLNDQDFIDPIESSETWPRSVATKLGGTAVVDSSVLATSDGGGGA